MSESNSPRLDRFRLLGRAASRFAPYRAQVRGSIALAVSLVGVRIASPLLLREVIDVALPHRDAAALAWSCGGMMAAGLLTSLGGVAQSALVNSTGQQVLHQLRVDLYRSVLTRPLEFFSVVPNSEIQARVVSDVAVISDTITITAQSFVSAVVTLTAAVVVMAMLSWQLALLVLALAWVLNLINSRFSARRRRYSKERQEKMGRLIGRVDEDLSLSGAVLGRTLRIRATQLGWFTAVSRQVADLEYRERLAGRTALAFAGAMFLCLAPMIYWLSGTLLPGVSVGTAVVLVMLQTYITGPIGQLLQLAGTVSSSAPAFERIFEYLDAEPVRPLAEDEVDDGLRSASTSPVMTAGLSYTYPGAAHAALTMPEAQFPVGSVTLVVGPSGSGKSTLGLLLSDQLKPTAGAWLTSEGVPVPRGAVCIAPQDAVLFDMSIAENLRLARPGVTDTELEEVLRTVLLEDFLRKLPDGLETQVGERGCRLSGGERQRIALARAMLSLSPILVLDEATSAVDEADCLELHEAVRQYCADRTLIFITHRIPAMRPDDRVLVVHDGRIGETGTHEQLAKRDGVYGRLLAGRAGAAAGLSGRSPSLPLNLGTR